MRKVWINLLKPLSFLPAIAMMIVISSFSAQTGEVSGQLSYEISYEIVEVTNQVMDTGKSPQEITRQAHRLHPYVRKAAHMTEFFLLAIAVSFPFYVYGIRGLPLLLLALAVCVSFAGFDEYHQSFVKDRGPSIKDVGIDSLGVLLGSLLVQAFCWSASHSPADQRW